MRIHINMLFESERRDPAVMVMRTTLATLALVAVAALALYALHAFIMMKDVERRQGRIKSQWDALLRDSNLAIQLRATCDELERVAADLAAFSNVQSNVRGRMLELAAAVPPEIQLVELKLIKSDVSDDGEAARQYEYRVTGRTAADGGDRRVQVLLQGLEAVGEPHSFGKVVPEGIRVDPQSKEVLSNVFELRCMLSPRRYR